MNLRRAGGTAWTWFLCGLMLVVAVPLVLLVWAGAVIAVVAAVQTLWPFLLAGAVGVVLWASYHLAQR